MDTLDDLIRDPRRLATLRRLALLDTPSEAAYDRLTELARKILNAPTSLVTLIDEDRQFFKSALGVGEPWASLRGTPLSYSFCKHSIPTGEPLIIEDARLHPLVHDSPAITELDVIAYAGIPLITSDGQVVGNLCVLDTQPRQWTDEEIGVLKELASIVMTEIALRIELKERMRMQEALRETEDRYRALFDRSQDAVFIHDFEGRFIDANDAALQLLNYTREDISSLNFLSLLTTPDQVPLAKAVIEEIKVRGFQETVTEFRWKTRTGDEVIVGTLASAIEHNGNAQAIQGIARDITLHKQAEEAFHKNYEKEKELANLRSRFMAMVSHDFRTPLAVIQSSSELLKQYGDRMSAEKRDSHLETIRNQIKRQLELLDDLMAINQAEDLGVSFKPGWMNWETFCRDMIHELQFTTGVNHRLEFVSSGTNIEAWTDEKLMRRALSNLLSNAIKYSPASSTVLVELFCDAAKTFIRIEDAGVGIPEKDLPHLFEPFYRASNARSIQGTGLGLVIVKQVIEAHGGTIDVESKVNAGTRFTITIPKLPRPVE